MLQLPFDQPEPFAATFGVMLYPDESETERRKACAYAAQHLAEPLKRAIKHGHRPSYDTLAWVATTGGKRLGDLDRWMRDGIWLGELTRIYYLLSYRHPHLASWENAARILEKTTGPRGGSRSMFMDAKKRMRSVAHLWGAFAIRGFRFKQIPVIGYDYRDDFEYFLADAQMLKKWGLNWKPKRAKAGSPLSDTMYELPGFWLPHQRAGWPPVGGLTSADLDENLLEGLRPAGRPRKN